MESSSSVASRNGVMAVCGGDVEFCLEDVDLRPQSELPSGAGKREQRAPVETHAEG
jgi:hypothetical protein